MRVVAIILTMLLLTLPTTAQAQTSKGSRYELRLLVLLPELAGDERTVLLGLGRNPTLLPAHTEAGGRYSLQAATNVRSAVVYLLRGGVEERRDYLTWPAYGGERQTVQASYRRNAVGGLELVGVQQAAGFVPTVANGDAPTTDPAGLPTDESSPFEQPASVATAAPLTSTLPISRSRVVSTTSVVNSRPPVTSTPVSSPPLAIDKPQSAVIDGKLLLVALIIGFVVMRGWRWLPQGKPQAKRKEGEDEQSQAKPDDPAAPAAGLYACTGRANRQRNCPHRGWQHNRRAGGSATGRRPPTANSRRQPQTEQRRVG